MDLISSTRPGLTEVLDELRKLEPLLHAGYDAERLVAPMFREVGASGQRYGRQDVLDVLRERTASTAPDGWRAEDFDLAPAGADHYLLTYTLRQPERVTRRLTVWQRCGGQWQAIYHQGTLVT